jgi:hypothetical protein
MLDPARMPHVKIVAVRVKLPLWKSAVTTTSPRTMNAAAEGTTKYATRRSATSSWARS